MAAKRAARTTATARRGRPQQRFCYVADLMKVLGVTRRTVYNYVQARLLPAPVLQSDGRTGVRSRWPRVALDHAEFIAEHQQLGYTNPEIAAMIAALWGMTDKLPPAKR